jgi:hypothetical protein
MEVARMIDPERLDHDAREVWDEVFPDGFWAGAPHLEGDRFRLWSYAYWCQLELGRVPAIVNEVLTREDYVSIAQSGLAMREKIENTRRNAG